jgi:Uracil DNA glycosylase superfamily
MIEELAGKVPSSLAARSGKVFYAGRDAFAGPSDLYLLGVNPGGDPDEAMTETVGSHTRAVLHSFPTNWSAYRDEVWKGYAPGTYGMAPRILHLCAQLAIDPGHLPSSNLVFARSRREEHIADELQELSNLCWPFHEAAIDFLRPKAILCLGATAGKFVRKKLSANTFHSEFIEMNNRRWRSQVFEGRQGIRVIVATHPSIADWTATPTDPTPLIQAALR